MAAPLQLVLSFLESFGVKDVIQKEDLLVIQENVFLVSAKQREIFTSAKKKPVFVGNCLGRKKGELFFPSVWFLEVLSKHVQKKIVVDKKTEWLFICGRDIFNGVVDVQGSPQDDEIVLVLNQYKECMGLARFASSPTKKNPIKNVYDVGDYLRRERTRKL